MFESIVIVNQELLSQFKRYVFSPLQKAFFILLILVCIIMGPLCYFIDNVIYSFVFFILGVIIGIEYLYIINKFYKLSLERLEEINGAKETKYKISFDENSILVNNLITSAKSNIKYDSFVRLVELDKAYALITKAKQVIFISKGNLNIEDNRKFKIFIKDKCKKIK